MAAPTAEQEPAALAEPLPHGMTWYVEQKPFAHNGALLAGSGLGGLRYFTDGDPPRIEDTPGQRRSTPPRGRKTCSPSSTITTVATIAIALPTPRGSPWTRGQRPVESRRR